MHLNGQSSTIYNSQDKKQPKCQSTDDWVKKMWVKWNIIFVSYSVVSDSLQPCGLQLARFPCPWNSPGKNTRVGCHSLPQGTFPTQGLNLRLLHCGQIPYHLSHRESTKWNIAQPLKKKEWKIATCSNMDGPRDHHTKWNVTEKTNIIWYHL